MGFAVVDYQIMALLAILILGALAVVLGRNLLYAVIVYGIYSLIMAVVWLLMNAPDLGITEAAAGIGTTALTMAVLSRTSRKDE
ncbi:MAG: DUF4040 domain-containing protein [Limnochordia bacterium]|jgi:uncharacterized MnhB-related membrane protein|nr:DUF4040 domain-containing protein [Limnochordia bacterium]